MATRQGPLLRIEGSCEGCAWLRHAERRYVGDEHTYRITVCAHEKAQRNNAGEPMAMHDSGGPERRTPPTCPELSAARLTLARSVVAEAECRVDPFSSRGRERGTRSCVVKHADIVGPARGEAETFCEPGLSLAEMLARVMCNAPSNTADKCSAARGAGEESE